MNVRKTCVFACAFGVAFLAFGVDYTYDVGAGGQTMAVGDIPSDATTVTKKGVGVLTFTGDGGAFAGKFIVEKGTVKAQSNAFAAGSSVEVQDGATWDMAGGGATWTAPAPSAFTIAGTGDAANGYAAALKRSSGTFIRSGSAIALSADATVDAAITHNFGSLQLQNHKLTKIGSGTWDAYGGFSFATGGDDAAIEIKAGNIQMQDGYPFNGGKASNVLTLHEGVSFVQYPIWGPTFAWKLRIAGNATLKTQSDGSKTAWPNWAGPVELTGGNLTIDTASASYKFNISGNVTAAGAYGIVGNLSGTSALSGSVTVTNIVNTKRGTLTFNGDVTVNAFSNAVGKADANACGTIVFKGNVTQGNASAVSKNDRGQLRFEGCDSVVIKGPLGASGDKGDTYGNQPTGTYSVVNVKYFSHPNTTYLSGTFAGPQSLVVSNSTWDCGSAYVIAGNNYSHGRVSYLDSVVTNCLTVGGFWSDAYGSRGSAWVRNTSMTVPARPTAYEYPLAVGISPGGYGYLQADGSPFDVKANVDTPVGRKGTGFMYLTAGSKAAFASSFKTAQDAAGYAAILLSGGSQIEAYQVVSGSGVCALEGEGTAIAPGVSFNANPLNGPLVLALNDGAAIEGSFCRVTESQTEDWHLCVNGGELRPYWYGEFFGNAAKAPTSFVVGAKGVVVDTAKNGGGTTQQTTFCIPMTAPTGKVVASVALPTDAAYAASTYFGPAKVTISGAGTGAAAIALYDFAAKRITGIKVVSGGTGYDDSTTATIASANGTTTYACAVTMAAAPTTGRGLVKRGANRLLLDQANTYKGPTTVEGGELLIAKDCLPVGSDLAVSNTATLNLNNAAFTTPSLTGGGTLKRGTVTTSALNLTTDSRMTVEADASIRLADGATVALTGDLAALDKSQKYLLVGGAVVCEGTVTVPTLSDHWKISVRSSGITLKQEQGLAVIIR